jgi:hypothetical protein
MSNEPGTVTSVDWPDHVAPGGAAMSGNGTGTTSNVSGSGAANASAADNGTGTATKLRDAEPVVWVSSITNSIKTLVLALIALALAFGWVNWSDQQNAAVLGVVAAGFVVLSSAASAVLRQKVTPTASPRLADGTPLKPES